MKLKKKKTRRSDFKVVTKEARILKFLRESRKLSMRKAARAIGVSEAIVNHIENGRMDISPKYKTKFLKGYGYSLTDLENFLNGSLDIPEHTLSECIEILKRLSFEKLKSVKVILDTF